jgi:catechol 2,3-dioxygenase-like lactoylglutathione lyase family enzyme
MLHTSPLIAFVPSTDLDRSRRFFGDTLDFPLLAEDPGAITYDANGTKLRVTLVPALAPAPFTVVGWAVADLATTIDTLVDAGVTFVRYEGMDQDERGVWTAPGGDRVAWFHDPDGNTLSLTEFGDGD